MWVTRFGCGACTDFVNFAWEGAGSYFALEAREEHGSHAAHNRQRRVDSRVPKSVQLPMLPHDVPEGLGEPPGLFDRKPARTSGIHRLQKLLQNEALLARLLVSIKSEQSQLTCD